MYLSIIEILAWMTLVTDIFLVVFSVIFAIPSLKNTKPISLIVDWFSGHGLLFAWIVALTATSGSLYFSEIAGFAPCELCWFQRIFMYPQAFILGLAWFKQDYGVKKYIYILCILGAMFSLYNYYIQIFPPLTAFCSIGGGSDCSQVIVRYFGYITISIMALSSSVSIFLFTYLSKPKIRG